MLFLHNAIRKDPITSFCEAALQWLARSKMEPLKLLTLVARPKCQNCNPPEAVTSVDHDCIDAQWRLYI